MFQFMRKSEKDKEKSKIPKPDQRSDKNNFGKKVKDKLSPEDLHRLDEIRRSFKLGKGRKEKQKLPSGIIADYSENFVNPVLSPQSPDSIENFASISHSDSSESSLSSASISLKAEGIPTGISMRAGGPVKPPRMPPPTKTPPPVPSRKPPSQSSSSSRQSREGSINELPHGGYGISRPPTSASSSSFTPSYITPPQSPSHNVVSLAKFYQEPELDLGEKVLPNVCVKSTILRTININRLPSGDFGFSLRRASVSVRGGSQENILFAEPAQSSTRQFDEVSLLPGDRLLNVNGRPMEFKSRDEVIEVIRSTGNMLQLQVLSNPLWIENIENIQVDQDYDSTDSAGTPRNRYWVVHKTGFVNAAVVSTINESGKCTVRLDNGKCYDVHEDDMENTNPENFDSTPHLWKLNLINESSILHILRNRFHSSLPFTLATNNNLLYLTRNAKLDTENYKFLRLLQPESSTTLHSNTYSIAFRAYRDMISTRKNQSIVIHGQSEVSTKRECVHEILKFFSEGRGIRGDKTVPGNKTASVPTAPFLERMQAAQTLVEYICSSSGAKHDKGTVLYNLEFDLGGRLFGMNMQIFTMDLERVYEPPYFSIIQALHDVATCPTDLLGPYPCLKQLRKDLFLTEGDADAGIHKAVPFFCSDISKSSDTEENLNRIRKVSESLLLLGLGETFSKSVWAVFGAVYHMGHVLGAIAAAINSGSSSSKDIEGGERHFQSACALLGLPVDRVEKTLVLDESEISRIRNILGFSLGLYFECVNAVFTTVNKCNGVGFRNVQSLSVNVVHFGFSPGTNGKFGDLACNYMNERVASLIKEVNFDRKKKLFVSEGIDTKSADSSTLTPVEPKSSTSNGGAFKAHKDESDITNYYDVLPLLDSFPSTAPSNSQKVKGRGLFFLLDDAKEASQLLEKFEGEFFGESQFKNLYAVNFRNTTLSLCHSNGNRIVDYDMKKIIKHTDISSASKFTNLLVQESQKDSINCMFLKSSNSIIGLCLSSLSSEIGLRRASSIRRNYANAWKKKTASLNVKMQTDYLMEILERTQIQFFHCLNPSEKPNSPDLDAAYLRKQIRAVNLSDTIRFYKTSYLYHLVQGAFVRRFKCLGSPDWTEESLSVHDRVIDILNKQDVAQNTFRIGSTMIFMKPWLIEELEGKRDKCLYSIISTFQSTCRGFLSRRRLEKLKIKDVAIRCVQKNVRKLLAVRTWSWWRMYQQISPLIKVQSSQEKLQSAQDELASIKLKWEKVESERARLESENEKLEIRVNELSAELNEEQAAVAGTTEKLEAEMNEKQKCEGQLVHLKNRCQSLEAEKYQLELDLAYSISEVGADGNTEDYMENTVYKQRWERSNREVEILKQKIKQREQDYLDQIMVLKKSLEKKCSDAWEEAEEQRQVVSQLKRRIQKQSSELSDVRCLMQEESSRCALLDKKQRRFDSELITLNTQLEKERGNKERNGRERDAAVIQRDSISNELQGAKMELQAKDAKLLSLQAELEETTRLGGNNEQMMTLRKAKNDLQSKVRDQEEELDDLAGQVQSLEAVKIRLEMQLEQMRKEFKREIQQREEELEDIRNSAHKKVKALECQLESEHDERTAILRSKQDLERKMFDMEELSASRSVSQEYVSRLKRELKRTKALLKDAQTMMEQSKNDALNKGMLRQLRHQLEDAESSKVRLSRAKQKVEEELADAQQQLEDVSKGRTEAENVKSALIREKAQMQMLLEENEEQVAEVMRKYKASVEQLSADQTTLTEQSMQICELESANCSLKETIAELNARLESLEGDQASLQIQKRFQMKVRELETRLELEVITKGRLEGQVNRLKEQVEKLQDDIKNVQCKEYTALDKLKKAERQLRDSKEEAHRQAQREAEAHSKRSALEKQLENTELEISTLKNDLKLAMQRIEDLTTAMKECDVTDDDEDSSTESVGSDFDIMDSISGTPTNAGVTTADAADLPRSRSGCNATESYA